MAGYERFAEVYDILTADVDYDALAAYYDGMISLHKGKRGILLDLACGTGSMSRRMAAAGHDVIGVDISADMLSIAKSAPHDGIEYLCQDMRSLDMYGTVDNVICVLDSINHLADREDILRCFRSVSLFCNPDALFLFDINTVKKHREILADNTFVYDTDGVYCVWQNFYDEKSGRVDICLDIFKERGGLYERFCEDFSETALPVDTVKAMLYDAGFDTLGVYDFQTRDKGTEECEKVLFCAKKTR